MSVNKQSIIIIIKIIIIYLNFAGIYNIKVVALVALINDDLPGYGTDWKHSIKDI